jgi:hypothetical protein
MSSRAAVLAFVIVAVAACSVTVVPPSPAPQPASVAQLTPPAPAVQEAPPAPPPIVMPDPPTRVGRLGLVLGTVSFRPAETGEWVPAEANWPVASLDRVWTDADSRAEVDVGAVVMRVGPQSELDVVELDDRTVQVRLPQGTLTERVLGGENGEEHEIDAPNAAVSATRPGVYRVDVSPDGMTTTVTVWGGEATVSEAGSSFVVNARQAATVSGPGDAPTFQLAAAAPPDAFDRWGMQRDADRDRLTAGVQYVPVGMPGAADLAGYGRWEVDPELGPVWTPTTVAPGWVPYRTGRWAFVRPWGWTWVDTAPWGYAPYHYGRWAYRNGAWGWCPGRPTNAPPAYAPALVAFVNAPAPHASTVAWVPLGPGEPYQPAYAASAAYRARLNPEGLSAVTYRNSAAPNAVTVVQQQTFATQQHVEQHLVVNQVKVVSIIAGAPSVQPVRIVPVSRAVPPAATSARAVVAIHAPTAERHDVVIIHPDVRAASPARTEPTLVSAQPARPVAASAATTATATTTATTTATATPPTEAPTAPARLTPMTSGKAWKAGQVSPALEADYERQKAELDDRQRSEKEHPKEGENAADRDARHEQEKHDLDAAYERAKAAGAMSIPRESAQPH